MDNEWTANAAFSRPPCSIPNHDLLCRIGSSSHSEVWLARQQVLRTLRAVKIVRPHSIEAARHLEKEIAGVRCFEPVSREHEGLMDLLEVGACPDHSGFWYVMELADPDNAPDPAKSTGTAPPRASSGSWPGADRAFAEYRPRTLATELARRGHFSPRETLEIGLGLADALAYLHSRHPPLVHRDIKPENAIYAAGRLKLADPGLVSWSGEHVTWCGTSGYVAPEGPGKPPADVFNLGKTLYAVVTGLPPSRFPEMPTTVDPSPDPLLWRRLNAVLCHACENAPSARYRSAVELRDDLARIRAGREPRLGRSAAPRRIAGVAALGAGLLLALMAARPELWSGRGWERLLRGGSSGEAARIGEAVFQDHFLNNRLNPELWTWNFWQTNAVPLQGRATRQVSVANGTLRIENQVLHEGGWNIKQAVWVLSRHDLKPLGDSWIEVELSGRAGNASFKVALAAADGPWSKSVDLINLYERSGGRFQPAQIERVRVEVALSPASGLALVRWSEPDGPQQRLVDVSGLPAWRLLFFTAADSANGMDVGHAQLTVHSVRASRVQLPRRVAGWVTLAHARVPVSGVEVFNRRLGRAVVTDGAGAFVLPAGPGWNEVELREPAYQLVAGPRPVRAARSGFTRCSLEALKTNPGRGDVVAARPISRRPLVCLALGPGHLYSLSAGGLYRYERASGREEYLGPLRPDIGLCWAAGNLFAVGTFREARLFEVDLESRPVARAHFGLPTPWPMGLTWDGTNFWFVEFNNQHTNRFGVYGVDAASGAVRVHLSSSDTQLRDVAWGAGRLWVTSASAGLYEVDPVKARQGGTLEAGILTNYPGLYGDIEFADNHLWLLASGYLLQIRVEETPVE
jgi:hypothetical protein